MATNTSGLKKVTQKEMGPRITARCYYDDAGAEITYEQALELRKVKRQARLDEKAQKVDDAWSAELGNRSIFYDGDMPMKLSDKVSLRCGCEKAKKFEATIYQVARLPRDKMCCTRCREVKVPANFERTVKAKGGTLKTPYNGAKAHVEILCKNGHTFHATPSNIMRKRTEKSPAGSWCPQCATGTNGQPRVEEILAERGCQLVTYAVEEDTRRKCFNGPEGEEILMAASTILATPPTWGGKNADRTVRVFVNKAMGFSYVLVDDIPPRLPKLLKEMIKGAVIRETHKTTSLPKAHALLRKLTEGYNAMGKGYRCLNVMGNATWEAPGIYSWGTIDPFHGTLVKT